MTSALLTSSVAELSTHSFMRSFLVELGLQPHTVGQALLLLSHTPALVMLVKLRGSLPKGLATEDKLFLRHLLSIDRCMCVVRPLTARVEVRGQLVIVFP